MNQIWVFIYKPPQVLSIQDITEFPISLRVLGLYSSILNTMYIGIGLESVIVCRKYSSRRLRASVKIWSRWSGSPFLGRSKRLCCTSRRSYVDIIKNAPQQRISEFHIHLCQSKHNARGESERYRRAWRAAQRGAAGYWRGRLASCSVPNMAPFCLSVSARCLQ